MSLIDQKDVCELKVEFHGDSIVVGRTDMFGEYESIEINKHGAKKLIKMIQDYFGSELDG